MTLHSPVWHCGHQFFSKIDQLQIKLVWSAETVNHYWNHVEITRHWWFCSQGGITNKTNETSNSTVQQNPSWSNVRSNIQNIAVKWCLKYRHLISLLPFWCFACLPGSFMSGWSTPSHSQKPSVPAIQPSHGQRRLPSRQAKHNKIEEWIVFFICALLVRMSHYSI